MTGNEMILLAFAVMLVMLFAKVPVFIAVFSGSVIYFLLTPGVSIAIFAQKMIGGVESIPLLAVPFFVCASAFMNYSGVTERIYTFAGVLAGRMSGGLAQVNVLVSTLMGGRGHGREDAGAADGEAGLFQGVQQRGFLLFGHHHASHPAGNRPHRVRLRDEHFHRKAVRRRLRAGISALCHDDGTGVPHLQKEGLSSHPDETLKLAGIYKGREAGDPAAVPADYHYRRRAHRTVYGHGVRGGGHRLRDSSGPYL